LSASGEEFNPIEDIEELFEVFDEDSNGTVDDDELDFMLQRFDIVLDEEGIRMLIFKYNKTRREKDFRKKGLPQVRYTICNMRLLNGDTMRTKCTQSL
jgi:Ca2+-binding EF-hand superfamily protein